MVTYPVVPVERIPSCPVWPSPLSAMSKFDFGTFPFPKLVKGPPRVSETGPLTVLDPDGFSVRSTFTFPLLMACVPLNVCCRRELASPELLPPHAATATATIAALSRTNTARASGLRADTDANLPLRLPIGRRPLDSPAHAHAHDPLHRQGWRWQDLSGGMHR